MEVRPSLSESDRLQVFVSHLWERNDAYEQLASLLRAMFGESLVDHSIPKTAALRLMSSGPQALEEERQLQQAHIETVTLRLAAEVQQEEMRTEQLRALEQEISASTAAADLRKEVQELETQLSNPEPLFLGQRGLRAKQAHLERLREMEARLPVAADPLPLKQKARDIEVALRRSRRAIAALQNELDARRDRVANLCAVRDGTWHNVHHHSDVLMRAIRDPQSITRRHANLALAIYDRIRRSDVIFMLVTAHDMYREWMEFESDLATDMHKPVITVHPDPGGASTPPELYRYSGLRSVRIDAQEVMACLQGIFRERSNVAIWCQGPSASSAWGDT